MFSKALSTIWALISIMCLTLPVSPVTARFAVEDGLISYWSFDTDTIKGDTVEDIWGAQDATMMGNPKIVDGNVGEAIELNGTTDYLLVTDDINKAKLPQKEITAEVWIYPKHFIEWGGYIGAFQDNGGFEKGWVLGTNHQFSFAVSTVGADDGDGSLFYLKTGIVKTDEWYHLVGTYDGKTMKIYVNGNLEGEFGGQSGDINYPDRLFLSLGVYKDDNEHFPHMGMLDELRLYEKALSADEVLQNYNSKGLAVAASGKLSTTWGSIKAQR